MTGPHLFVEVPGALTTVQDLGRFGSRHLGVPVAGAVDLETIRIANALVGNLPDAAALELRLAGPTLEARGGPVRMALAGPLRAEIRSADGARRPAESWRTHRLAPGDRIVLGPVGGGVGYLAVAGGIDVPSALGSRSTHLRSRMGGVDGRALAAGDVLPVGRADDGGPDRALPAPAADPAEPRIRVVLGPHDALFPAASIDVFLSCPYTVTREADRMGLRLSGPAVVDDPAFGANLPSDGMTPGAIQVPGSGQPIVLLADAQTIGGYAKIATVISADLPLLGRMLPGASLRFRAVVVEEAVAAAVTAEAALDRRIAAIGPAVAIGDVDVDRLYGTDLISGVVDARTGDAR